MIVYDMPAAEYHALDRASAHGLMMISNKSPMHFRESRLTPHEPTPAQWLGTLAHAAILERRYPEVAPECDRRTAAGKAIYANWQNSLPADALIATPEQYDQVQGMEAAVRANPYAAALLSDGRAEVTLLWEDAETGVACKARIDWICGAHEVVVDFKTARSAHPETFAKDAGNFRYPMQNAWYLGACEACGLGKRTFVFVVSETEPPHAVALYTLDEAAIAAGRTRARRALARYAECQRTGIWPGYDPEIQVLEIPKWAL